ncbi:MAG: DUF1570 domain-containing protein [Planctomycetota bacterium]|nr:DUF1570 domain-containing protein [Planctomycetota bacterium]
MKYLVVATTWHILAVGLLFQVGSSAEPLIEVHLPGDHITGTPLHWSAQRVTMLTPDGARRDFAPNTVQRFARLDGELVASTQRQVWQQLRGEFGTQFSIKATEHYLVVHPADHVDRWSSLLENLYSDFHGFFQSHHYALSKTRFPLVVIVLPNRESLLQTAALSDHADPRKIAGYYCDRSNRIWVCAPPSNSRPLPFSAHVTLRHEATHQLAFNTGVHERFGTTPRWVAEGLAMLFEMPQLPASFQTRNRQSDSALRQTAFLDGNDRPGVRNLSLQLLITDDSVFQQRPELAYAQSASLTRFLIRTHPAGYLSYLKHVAARPRFTAYAADTRRTDFSSSFPGNMAMLESQWQAFSSTPH